MGTSTALGWRAQYPALSYCAPFLILLALIALNQYRPISPFVEWPLQTVVLAVVCVVSWPPELAKRPRYWVASIAVGLAVFFIWIGPDVLIHGYRQHFLFTNALFGAPHSSIPPAAQRSLWVLVWRTARASLVVPIAEELFWRGFLMRWFIHHDFQSVRLGAYTGFAFFFTALLFASEHGPYWDVGLVAGIIYNLWMIRTRSLPDCILMHAVTNFVLSLYVLNTGNWQYWM